MLPRASISARRIGIALLDSMIVIAAYYLAFLLRFDFHLNTDVLGVLFSTLSLILGVYFLSFVSFGLYRGIYYFSSFSDLINITKGVAAATVLTAACILFLRQGQFPRSCLVLHPVLTFLGVGGIRFGIRFVKTYLNMPRAYSGECRHALLVGAGDLGESLLRQMLKTSDPHYKVVGFVDDDPAKWGMRIHGYTVFGGQRVIKDVLQRHQVDEIIIAIATKRGAVVRSVVEALKDQENKPELKIAPSLEEMLKAPGAEVRLRQVRPADLLNREEVKLDTGRIAHTFTGKVVLVTGAGGTIGGELCRQVLRYHPEKLIILESHATSLFYQEAALTENSRGTAVVPVLGDIRDQALIDRVFKTHRPHVVLHAAAHKHVHQLEFNVQEGVGNNILGTNNLASAADRFGAESFLLVSTDKAVRPTSVMGATKRVAELVIRGFSRTSRTRFAAVRFGNVLGSSGSVLPIFQDQLAKGGPLTVSDPEVQRYFMTVEEAVGLILQAVSMAKGGEIFILKMGTPVRILDMAKNLILLSGLEPGKDVEIRITGLRQGEKLSEELVEDPASVGESEHADIMLLKPDGQPLEAFPKRILEIEILSRSAEAPAVLRKIAELVPTFKPAAAHWGPEGAPDTALPAIIDVSPLDSPQQPDAV